MKKSPAFRSFNQLLFQSVYRSRWRLPPIAIHPPPARRPFGAARRKSLRSSEAAG